MKFLRNARALLVAAAMVVALLHPTIAVAGDGVSRVDRLASFAMQDDDDDGSDDDGGDDDGSDGDSDDDDDVVEVPADVDDDDDDDVVEVPAAVDDDDDDEAVVQEAVDDDGAVVQDADDDDDGSVVVQQVVDDDDDDDGFGGGEIDEPRDDQAIVRLNAGVDPEAFAAQHGATVMRVIPTPNIVLLSVEFDESEPNVLDELLSDPAVEWGERNYSLQAPEGRVRYFFSGTDGTPQLVDQPGLPLGLPFNPAASCVTGASVVVAVLDTGIDIDHPAIAANILPNGVNMVDNTFDVQDFGNDIDDDRDGEIDEMVGHGTHVSGTVLQVAPEAGILPIKVLNSDGIGDAFFVTSGIYYAVEQGADVINVSLSSTFNSRAVQDAIDDAIGQGVVVVAAVGNGNRAEPVEYPAALEPVISVAAITSERDKAEYSNFNSSVDISAPGNDVASTYPDGRYATASGTSMSTSIVAGGVALLLERQPDIEPAVIEDILTTTANPLLLSDPSLAGQLGAGAINIDESIACGG